MVEVVAVVVAVAVTDADAMTDELKDGEWTCDQQPSSFEVPL